MSVPAVALIASTFLYTGFQWTIRVLVYPQFAAVPPGDFARYELAHQRRTAFTVGPLFLLSGAAAVFALICEPDVSTVVVAACLAVVLGTTAFAAVPRHRRLSEGFDADVLAGLLRVDAVRLGAAAVACAASVTNAFAGAPVGAVVCAGMSLR